MNVLKRKIYDSLISEIETGMIRVGERLPTEKELSTSFGTNRMIARECLVLLKKHGIAVSNKKGGTILRRPPNVMVKRIMNGYFSDNVFVFTTLKKHVASPWGSHALSSLQDELSSRKLNLIHKDFTAPLTRETLAVELDSISSQGFHALIFLYDEDELKGVMSNADLIFKYSSDNVFVFASGVSLVEECPFNVVALDHFQDGVCAAEYIVRDGIDRVVYLENIKNSGTWWELARKNGLTFGCSRESANTVYPEIWQRPPEEDFSRFISRLEECQQRTAVVISTSDEMLAFVRKAQKSGVKIPEDVLVVSFGRPPVDHGLPVVTVEPPYRAIGSTLGRLITGKIAKDLNNSRLILKLEPCVSVNL